MFGTDLSKAFHRRFTADSFKRAAKNAGHLYGKAKHRSKLLKGKKLCKCNRRTLGKLKFK